MNRVVWNSLLVVPVLWGAALLAAAPSIAAEKQARPEQAGDVSSTTDQMGELSAIATEMQAHPGTSSTSAQASGASASAALQPHQGLSSAPIRVAQAVEPAQSADPSASQGTMSRVSSLDQINQSGQSQASASGAMGQVTSITQLSDVRPTDWAYQALQSLVERYGCIVGYPDRTYKGSRALTRYEFAAGLNACLDRISELIASSTANLATKEDLATIQRLQEEFAAELATLRGRVDSLEARTSELEANQFSTTTKLQGETLFVAAAPITEDNQFSDQAIGGYRVRLNLLTSFTGRDQLKTRLQMRNFGNFEGFGGAGGLGGGFTNWNFSSDSPTTAGSNQVTLDDLWYKFPVGNRITVTVGANAFNDTDLVISPVTPFEPSGTGSLSRFGHLPQYTIYNGNTGLGVNVKLGGGFYLDGAYTAGGNGTSAQNPSPGNGLFNGNYAALGQLTYLSKFLDAAFTYVNTYARSGFFSNLGVDGGPEVANVYGAQVNFKFGSFQIGGGGTYIPIRALDRGDYDAWSYQVTLALRDLGGEGNLLGVLAGVTPYASGIPGSIVKDRTNQSNNVLVEGFYRFNINDNISITPDIIWLTAPSNNSDNDSTVVGAIRTVFRF